MLTRLIAAALMVIAVSAPAFAQERLQLFRDVQKQVLRYPHFTIFDSVNAQISDDVITLTGRVTMPYKRDDIAKRVARISGAHQVRNEIEVLPVSQFDDDLRLRVARAIYGNPNFRHFAAMANPPIHVIVERGRVTLEGVVQSDVDRMLARSIAGSFLSFDITNALKTEAEVRAELEKL